jgi:hypothetical protein
MTAPTKLDRAALSVAQREPARVCRVTGHANYSHLTPELKEVIDRTIVPILVKKYLVEVNGIEKLADVAGSPANSDSKPDGAAGKARL